MTPINAGSSLGLFHKLARTVISRTVLLAGPLVLGVFAATPSQAYVIFVCEFAWPDGAGQILRVDPTTGSKSVLAAGNLVYRPLGVTFGPDGALYVVQYNATVIRIDSTTGAQSLVTSGGYLHSPWGITATGGNLYVTDQHGHPSGTAAVIRIQPETGAQSLAATGGFLLSPFGITTTSTGDLLVADQNLGVPGSAVIRINPASGGQTLIWAGSPLGLPYGIATASDGEIYITDLASPLVNGFPAIFRLGSGEPVLITSDRSLSAPVGIAVEPSGALLASDDGALPSGLAAGAVFRVDPVLGTQIALSSGSGFLAVRGIALGPDIPTPVRQPTLGSLKARYR